MKKCTVLIPTKYNDGSPVELYKTENALLRISDLIGGYTIDGTVEGAYRMKDGKIQREVSRKIWAVCDDSHIPALRALVKDFVKFFHQECMYFEVETANVEFLTG